jgi:carboxylesterase type B
MFNTTGNFCEDCLTLNVARPANAHNLPVAVWIYGGAFVGGSSSMASYNLSWFVNASVAASKPLVAVSLNYRLMYFGFLAGSDLSAEGNTNIGLYDQRLALLWIKENIAAFGGDPTKVTVFGESAYGPFTSVFNIVGQCQSPRICLLSTVVMTTSFEGLLWKVGHPPLVCT